MWKVERGTSDFAFDKNLMIFLMQWNENSTVTFTTHFITLEPFVEVQNQKQKKNKIYIKLTWRFLI